MSDSKKLLFHTLLLKKIEANVKLQNTAGAVEDVEILREGDIPDDVLPDVIKELKLIYNRIYDGNVKTAISDLLDKLGKDK